jgi:putative toxin-antitoxin system antitoxin component (TIGR02293 family)
LNKYKNENVKLSALLSEHAIKFTELYKLGIEVFGNNSEFNDWLMDESLGLGYEKPADLLNTSAGLEMVSEELMRIAYGATA